MTEERLWLLVASEILAQATLSQSCRKRGALANLRSGMIWTVIEIQDAGYYGPPDKDNSRNKRRCGILSIDSGVCRESTSYNRDINS